MPNPAPHPQASEVEALVRYVADECRAAFTLTYGVAAPKVDVRTSWSPRRTHSRGGYARTRGPCISIALRPRMYGPGRGALSLGGAGTFAEYDHVARDCEIGTVRGTVRQSIVALVCHEMAHAFQKWLQHHPQGRMVAGHGDVPSVRHCMKPHGEGWQAIYRVLRRSILNRELTVRKAA